MAEDHKHLDVLFVGLGNSRVAWYRCVLPAMYLGCDWCGLSGIPPYLQFATGYVKGRTQLPTFEDYDVVILQQPRGRGWFDLIRKLKAAGKVVLAEYDDYVHGIRKARDHDFSMFFKKEHLKAMELCLRACDGLICSTDYIARRYKSLVPKVYVCENGLDMGRYRVTPPRRGLVDGVESITLMWSGATGHTVGAEPWLAGAAQIMRDHPHVCLATIGQPFAQRFGEEFGERVISVPFAALETYPSAMMIGDIALAPAGKSSWYRGKSDLRAMEAAALGIPVVADRHYEGSVVHGTTGLIVDNPGQAREHIETLVRNPDVRQMMGDAARQYAQENFDMKVRREQWHTAIIDAYSSNHEGEFIAA